MKGSRAAIGAIVLASVVALATPLTAQAARGGGGHFGGGGGGHFGGGGGGFHFGGGGFHPGGGGIHFGGGGMRLGGGGIHFGGGRMRLGGLSHLGRMHLGGGHIGGFRSGGGRTHLGGLSSGRLSRGAGRGLRTGRAGRELQTGRSFANLHGLSRGRRMVATRLAPGFSRRTFARAAFGGGRFGRFDDDRFGHFHRFGVFGWAGPVFWPYAYNDIYCDIFWGYWGYGCADPYWSLAYGNPFWGYGYGDIYGGLFSPFDFNDLAAYLPSGGRRGRSTVAAASQITAQMCGDDTREVADWPINRIRQLVSPDDQQSMALDDLADASLKAAQIIKDACPTSVAFTPTGRLAAMQRRIEAMQQAVDVVRGPLDRFYAALTDEQKAKLNSANQAQAQPNARSTGLVQSCNRSATTEWPQARIETAVRPSEEQQMKLKALESAATQAAQQLAASCPSELPATPPARLAAVSKRLDVMLQAVKSVRVALDDFYGDLNDEQKAQFDRIGQSQTAER
jgi:hypothetical protein